jgi:putative CocE/NonD family hydrolase
MQLITRMHAGAGAAIGIVAPVSYHPSAADVHVSFSIPSGTPDRADAVDVVEDAYATTRDGVRLGADVYLPRGLAPAPAIVIRQPYGRRTAEMGFDVVGRFFAAKGYACVVQDVRGKFSSGGDFDPGVTEVDDGHDTVEWAVSQRWCDGRVGLWGESYYGFTSFAAAISGHPAIACIAPGDIGLDRRAAWLRQGAFLLNTTGYWAMAMDAREYGDVSAVDPYHLPLIEMPASAGLEGRFFRTLLDHADDGEWWDARTLVRRLPEVRVPVLSWGGWYDNYIGPQLDDRRRLLASHPRPETVHLLVGPWDHEGSAEYTDRAVCQPLPLTAQHRWDSYQAFFDHYLMGLDNGFGDEGPVEVFTLGASRWRHAPSWPPPGVVETPLYLRAGGVVSLQAPDSQESVDQYTYDPSDPVPETVGRNCWALCTALDDRRRLDGRGDILRYLGEPLDSDLELAGPLTAELYAATSAVDTDFTVTLCDVFEDGTVNTIQDGIVRARYRDGLDHPSLLEPGRVYRYVISLCATSYVVRRGHRLRVDVSSSNFDRYDRNPNTGERFGSSTRMLVAEQAIHHAPGRASHVVLPVITRDH